MGDSENALPVNRGVLPPDNPGLDDEEDSAELDSGPLGMASDEANRRTTSASASNAVGTNAAVAVVEIDIEDGSEVDRNKMVDVKGVSGEETTKDEDGKSSVDQDPEVDQAERKEAVENTDDGASSSFQQHSSSRNAFTELACSSSFGLGEDLGEKISSGTYSDLYKSTYLGKRMRTKRDVAVKVLKLDCIHVEEIVKQIHSMSQLKHRNLVEFVGACTQGQNVCIVTEYCFRGSLRSSLFKMDYLLKYVLKAAREAAQGMQYLHENNILHGSLSTSNLLIGDNLDYHERGVIKVSDFFVSKVKKRQLGVATTYDDVFRFGHIVWELITGGPRLKSHYSHYLTQGHQGRLEIPEALNVISEPKKVPKRLKELIERCWSDKKAERPTFPEIVDIIKKIELEPELLKNRRKEFMRLEKIRLEAEERQKAIQEVEDRVLKGGPRFLFGGKYILRPTREHLATVIWLHDWVGTFRNIGGINSHDFAEAVDCHRHIKWICPTAPTGGHFEEWYADDDQHQGLDESEAYIAELFKGEPENVLKVIGGSGTGARLALYFATRCVLGVHEAKLASVIAIDAGVPPQSNLLEKISTTDGALARAASVPILLTTDSTRPFSINDEVRKYHYDISGVGFKEVLIEELEWSRDSKDPNTRYMVNSWFRNTLSFLE